MTKIMMFALTFAGSIIHAVTMSGYNLCYIHTSIGYDNLNSSSLDIHIDSAYGYVNDQIEFRNIFENGYIKHSDWDGGLDFTVRNDSSIFYYQGQPAMGFVFDKERMIKKFGPSISHIEYYTDSIVSVDTVGTSSKEYYRNKSIFTNDSLYDYYYSYNIGAYVLNSTCKATYNECDCITYKYVFYDNYIEEYYDATLTNKYFISNGKTVTSSIKNKKQKNMQNLNKEYDLIGRMQK
jgi:hypothetical protein